ncbi:MAG: Smr/MutS family protein [Bdellovibrionales bacterium]
MNPTENLGPIDWNQILNTLSDNASSSEAKSSLKNTKPLDSKADALASFKKTDSFAMVIRQNGGRPNLQNIEFAPPILKRLDKNAQLDSPELNLLRSFLYDLSSLGRILSEFDDDSLDEITEELIDPAAIIMKINKLITSDGDFKVDASPKLYNLYEEKKELKGSIHGLLDRLVKQHELEHVLQDKFVTTRDGRWVLPIKNGMQGKFPGIIHDTSQSKQTVFMEPQEVVVNNNRIKEISIEIQHEIDRLLKEISDLLYFHLDELKTSYKNCLDADISLAKAKLKLDANCNECEFSEESIELEQLSNPLLELSLGTGKVIRNNFSLKESNTMILSGPNAGGKTILLKSLGLAAHMARCGLQISGRGKLVIPFFRSIHISVGDSQNITEGLSTFASHMVELNEATQLKGSKNLILIDEICGSTDPEEGSALAKSFIDEYIKNECFSMITSHLGALKQSWNKEYSILHASMEFDDETGLPNYTLLSGVSGSSYAWKTAKRMGVSGDILDRSLEYLSPETKEKNKKLSELEDLRTQLSQTKNQLELELKNVKQQKEKYKALVDKFKAEKDKRLDKSIKKAENRIEEELIKAREQKTTAFDLKASLPKIVKQKEEISVDSPESFNLYYPPGTMMYATNIQKNAIVQSKVSSKGEVEVLAGSMKISIPWEFLKPRTTDSKIKPEKRKKFEFVGSSAESEISTNKIDLRGQTVEEALKQLEENLDSATLNNQDKIEIIHGHGTQSLKKAVRSYLARSPYIDRWQAGGEKSGGDGVTLAFIR